MYTTFASFRNAGACRDGRTRFLSVIGGSSHALPHGGRTRLPVWLPMLMAPNDRSELDWMFMPKMTYIHDFTEFRRLFDITREPVARACMKYLLMAIRRMGRTRYGIWEDFGVGSGDQRLNNPERVRALYEFDLACCAALSEAAAAPAFNGAAMQSAVLNFESVFGNLLLYTDNDVDNDNSHAGSMPEPKVSTTVSVSNIRYMWPLFRMAVLEPVEGSIRASTLDQKRYTHRLLEYLWNFYAMADGIQFNFSKASKPRAVKSVPTPRRGRAVAPPVQPVAEPVAAEATPELSAILFSDTRLRSTEHKDMPGLPPIDLEYVSESAIRRAQARRQGIREDLLLRSPDSDERAYADEGEEYVANTDSDDEDEDGNDTLPLHLRKPKSFVVLWVYQTFDTAAFFGKLKFVREHALPSEGVTLDWLKRLSRPVETFVTRDAEGNFEAGVISVRSPRLMALMLQHIRTLQITGQIAETAPHDAAATAASVPTAGTAAPALRLIDTGYPREGDDEIIETGLFAHAAE